LELCSAFICCVSATSLASLRLDNYLLEDNVSLIVTFMCSRTTKPSWALVVRIEASWCTASLFSSIIQSCAVFTAGRVCVWWMQGGELAGAVEVLTVLALRAARVDAVQHALVVVSAEVPVGAGILAIDNKASW